MTTTSMPALCDGPPIFHQSVPITQPTMPPYETLEDDFKELFRTGLITNGKEVKALEEAVSHRLGVKHTVGLGSCTSGLLLAWKVLGVKPGGEVILPSFTFAATGHAILWNGLVPRFVDIESDTFLMDLAQVEAAINARTVGICGVHTFGNPCYPDKLESIASSHGIKLVFDSAHALGTTYQGKPMGTFGDMEIFSLSPTKLVVAAEGGLATTNDDEIARLIRIGRDYGNPGDYNCEIAGINGRMSEFHAILARQSFCQLLSNVEKRRFLADLYCSLLGELPGIRLQRIVAGGQSSYKDFAILVDAEEFGLTRDQLATALQAENIMTRKYFFPLVHQQRAYEAYKNNHLNGLPISGRIASEVLCLPIFSHLTKDVAQNICQAISRIYEHRSEVKTFLNNHPA